MIQASAFFNYLDKRDLFLCVFMSFLAFRDFNYHQENNHGF